MSIESIIYATLKPLVANHVYRDLAPKTLPAATPRITFQQVGGTPLNFIDRTKPSKKNARMQINCWHTRRDDAAALGRLVEDTLINVPIKPTPLGALVAVYEDETQLYGTRQDFSFWYDD